LIFIAESDCKPFKVVGMIIGEQYLFPFHKHVEPLLLVGNQSIERQNGRGGLLKS
jgi:hypothetical protein